MLSINTSINDLILQRTLLESTFDLNDAINRMTTGFKVNSAKDNAAGFSIIEELNTKISSMLQVQSNTESGVSLLNTAEGGLTEIQELLERLRELTTQAANGTYDSLTREAMQAEADSIVAEISRIKNSIQFDGMNLYETPATQSNNIATNAVARLSDAVVLNASESTGHSEALAEESQGLGVTNSNLGDSSVASLPQSDVMLMSLDDGVATASTTIEGSVDFGANETKTITIDGVSYEVTNGQSVTSSLSYVKENTTGQITFLGSNFTIKGQKDVSHNILIDGSHNKIYGGDLDDTIQTLVSTNLNNTLYGQGGNDTLIGSSYLNSYYGEDGNDTITLTNMGYVYAGSGDDIIDVTSFGNGHMDAGDGNDTITITGTASGSILGQGGDDKFVLNGNNILVNGGDGTNTVVDNGSNNLYANTENANAYIVSFTSRESKNITINGIGYEITNNQYSARDLIYSVNSDTGQITFLSQNFTIKGQLDKQHNVVLKANYQTFIGGDLADTVTIKAEVCTVKAGGGNDTINNQFSNSIIFAEDGDDTIVSTGYSSNYINGGNGNDNISAGSHTTVIGGEGDDNITLKETAISSQIIGGSGNNTIFYSKDFDENNILVSDFDNDNSSYITLNANGTREIEINGKKYSVYNRQGFENTLSYSYNAATGEIYFGGFYLTITADANTAQNVKIQGSYLYFYGSNLDDTISTYGHRCQIHGNDGDDTINAYGNDNYIYSEGGNDNITNKDTSADIYMGDGDDIVTNSVNGTSIRIYGEAGNDTYYINSLCQTSDESGNNIYHINTNNANITAGMDGDTFYVNGNNNTIKGAGGDDYVINNGSNNTVDGGTGNNYYIDNGTGNSYTNVIKDPNSGAIVFSYVGEVITKTINGREYSFTNNGIANNTLNYSVNANTDTVTFDGSDLQIKGLENQSHILAIRGSNNIVNGGNLNDKITIESGSNNTINANGGNDTIINDSENNAINGGDGNDTISLNKSTNLAVNSGNGADTINIASSNNTQVNAGSGDDTIVVNGANNTIKAQDGNNSITVNGDSNTISATTGNNKLVLASDDNTVTLGNGNNIYGISGDSNNVTAQNAVGTVNVMGAGNTVNQTQGVNDVVIKGNGNSYSSTLGSKDVKVTGSGNTIITGTDSDTVELNGDSNSITTAGGNNEITVIGNSNQIQGGNGIDTIKLTGNMNTALGGDGNDVFTLSRGANNTIDGEGGDRNTMVNYSDSITSTNVTDITPRPFELNVKVATGSADSAYISTKIAFNPIFLSVDLSSVENALKSLESIDEALMSVSEQLLNIGSVINRLEMALDEQNIKLENMISTRSTLRDADIAEESSNYIRYQILQQANVSLLSSSRNLRAENVLGLLQGLRR